MDIGKVVEIGVREIPTYQPGPTQIPAAPAPAAPQPAPERETA